MKYVKIYDDKMRQTGLADIEQNYDKSGYVKVFDKDMQPIGVMDVDSIPESGANLPFVKVYDENLVMKGGVSVDNIRHSDGYLITLQKDPSTTGSVSGGGRFVSGTSVTVVATPDSQSEYTEFDGWYEGDTKVSENASYTFTVSGARTLVAKFVEPAPTVATILYRTFGTQGTPDIACVNLNGNLVQDQSSGNFMTLKSNKWEIGNWGSSTPGIIDKCNGSTEYNFQVVDKNNFSVEVDGTTYNCVDGVITPEIQECKLSWRQSQAYAGEKIMVNEEGKVLLVANGVRTLSTSNGRINIGMNVDFSTDIQAYGVTENIESVQEASQTKETFEYGGVVYQLNKIGQVNSEMSPALGTY